MKYIDTKLLKISYDEDFEYSAGKFNRIISIKLNASELIWNRVSAGAGEGGHKKLVKFAINKGANNFRGALFWACKHGQKELIEWILATLDSNQVSLPDSNLLDWGLEGACFGGHKIIVELMIEKGATDFNWGLTQACARGHKKIAKMMIEKGAKKCFACNTSIKEHKNDGNQNYNITQCLSMDCI